MYPLPVHTVHLVLRYISPLSDPIPPHLISSPLRQRHSFLQISPSSRLEYLCWPSSDNAKTINILDRLPLPLDLASYSTRYTSDSESTFAHVQVSLGAQGLRMLFLWDDTHGWRYHDLRLMPFPPFSFSSPQESLDSNATCRPDSSRLPSFDLVSEADHVGGGGDSYWDAYGAAGHDQTSPLPLRSDPMPDAADGEDAYWAQYASVQGSADSTVPSPLPINRKPRLVDSHESGPPFPPQSNQVINVPVDAIRSRPLAPTLGPPSPNLLAHLLSTISARKESSIIDDPYSSPSTSTCSTNPSTGQTITDSELVTPPFPNEYLGASVASPDVIEVGGIPLSECYPCPLGCAEHKALTDSIRGLYCLWKAGRKEELGERDKSVFLRIVQAAIVYE